MINNTKCQGLKALDPVAGLIAYVEDIKPYHTKIIEILIEYVYNDDVHITIREEPTWQIDLDISALNYTINGLEWTCLEGYATHPYGDPTYTPVISPNGDISFADYPALDPTPDNTIIIPGLRRDDYQPGTLFDMKAIIEDRSNTYEILDVTPGAAGSGSFVVYDPSSNVGTALASHVWPFASPIPESILTVDGTQRDDNRAFVITSVDYDTPVVNQTTVHVAQAVLSTVPSGHFGILRTVDLNNHKTFTVIDSVESHGFIDSWPDRSDPSSYIVGDDPHTIIQTAENIAPIPGVVDWVDVTYQVYIRLTAISIDRVLSYSNFVNDYCNGSPEEAYSQTPTEGFNTVNILSATASQVDGFGDPISDTGSFVVESTTYGSNLTIGSDVCVFDTQSNNGIYTITSISCTLDGTTTIGVAELVEETVATPEGHLRFNLPSNVFIVSGNYTTRFTQGVQFDVSGGSFAGVYTTLRSDYENNETRIRVTKSIFNPSMMGWDVIDVQDGFVIEGNKLISFPPGHPFNIVGSQSNDGAYVVDTSVYNSTTNQTTIVPLVNGSPQTQIPCNDGSPSSNAFGGKIYSISMGVIKEHTYGYDETSDMCGSIPESVVHVKFDEYLSFEGLGLDLHDDVIAYNLENNDFWDNQTFELPFNATIGSAAPTITEDTSPPVAPDINDIWFNTAAPGVNAYASETLHWWSGAAWKATNTVFWLNPQVDILFYRTRNKFVDTGWVPYSKLGCGVATTVPTVCQSGFEANPFDNGCGFDYSGGGGDVLTSVCDAGATPDMQIVAQELFVVEDWCTTEDETFTFKTFSATIVDVEPETVTTFGYFAVEGRVEDDLKGFVLNVGSRSIIISDTSSGNAGTYDLKRIEYDDFTDRTKFYVDGQAIVDVPEGTLSVEQIIINDPLLLTIMVDGVPVQFELLSPTTFRLVDFVVSIGTNIVATQYARGHTQYNAYVGGPRLVPHTVYHKMCSALPSENIYVLYGGNYIERFYVDSVFDVYNTTGTPSGPDDLAYVGTYSPASFPILDVNAAAGTIRIEGAWEVLFASGRSFQVRLSYNNYENFVVDFATTILIPGSPEVSYTIIHVENFSNSPLIQLLTEEELKFNPGTRIYNIDNVSDVIILSTNVVDRFGIGDTIQVSGSTANNNTTYTVQSVSYDSINDRTNVYVVENIIDPDATGNGLLHTSIYQNYSRDLGVVVAATFDPQVNAGDPTDQVKTYVAVDKSIPIGTPAVSIAYRWIGPLRFDISLDNFDLVGAALRDRFGASNELTEVPDRYTIIDTDATAKTITIHYDDPILSIPVNLTDSFTAGTIFRIVDSYSGNNPVSFETNDARYVVKSATWDYPGTGDTIIEIDTDFDNIPPYNSFTVLSVSNNSGSPADGPNQIILAGNHVTTLSNVLGGVFYIDQPLVTADPLYNAITVISIEYSAPNTILTVEETFIDESYTGELGLIDAQYRADLFFDENNVTGSPVLWEHGAILREAFRIEQSTDNSAVATFKEKLTFGWGTVQRWAIVDVIDTDTVVLEGDLTSIILVNDRATIIGSLLNDGDYEVTGVTLLPGTPITTAVDLKSIGSPSVLLVGSPVMFGYLQLENVDITSWFQYMIKEAAPLRGSPSAALNIFEIWGDITNDVQSGQEFRVFSTSNDGIYTASGLVTYNSSTGTSDIPVAPILTNETGGWVESARDFGARLIFEDNIGVTVVEQSIGVLVITAGDVIGAWDYNYWDVGGWDENLSTTLYLHSNIL